MPTPPKRLANTSKHWTKKQLDARQQAEQGLKRPARVALRAPAWLGQDARKVWNSVKRKLRDVELLDSLDVDMLAIYCDLQARYQALGKKLNQPENMASDDEIKQLQAWARNILSYAEKLGLTPNSRARLAKKKAEAEPLDDMDQILNDVDQFINGGQ